MSLSIHNYFQFYTSGALEDEYLDFTTPGKILSFQEFKESDRWFNGINYYKIESTDGDIVEVLDEITGEVISTADDGTDYEFGFMMWDLQKLINIHPLTGDREGERIIGTPMAVENIIDAGRYSYIQMTSPTHSDVRYINYTPGTLEIDLEFKNPVDSPASLIGQTCVVASEVSIPWVALSGGSGDYLVTSEIKEWIGVITSATSIAATVTLDSTPSVPGELSDIKHLGFSGQKMHIAFLGEYKPAEPEGSRDTFGSSPNDIGQVSFSYVQLGDPGITTHASKYSVITPKTLLIHQALYDVHKFICIVTRDEGLTNYTNGFNLKSTPYV